MRRTLYNLKVVVANSKPESQEQLKEAGYEWAEIEAYRKSILNPKLPDGVAYTYGNRLLSHFGQSSLETIIKRLKQDPMDRKAFATTWDNRVDCQEESKSDGSVPCLTGIYFSNDSGKLMLTADFRTHSAVSAWLLNFYGLNAIQEYVSKEAGIEPGKLSVFSRAIAIDVEDSKTNSAMALVNKLRTAPIKVDDPRGYFIVSSSDSAISAQHFSQSGELLKTYEGNSALSIKNQLRVDSALDDPDHAMWVGYELARAEMKLKGKIDEL